MAQLTVIDIVFMVLICGGAGYWLYRKMRKGDVCNCSDCPDDTVCTSRKTK